MRRRWETEVELNICQRAQINGWVEPEAKETWQKS